MIDSNQQFKTTTYPLPVALNVQDNYKKASISFDDAKKNILSDNFFIKQRKISTEKQDINNLDCILVNVKSFITSNLKCLKAQLDIAINVNLINHLDRQIIKIIKPTDRHIFYTEDLLFALNKILNYIPELRVILNKNILLDKKIHMLIKDSPKKTEIVSEIIKLASVYKELKFILSTIFDDLDILLNKGIDIISTTDFTGLQRKEVVVLESITLRKLFDTTTPLYNKLNDLLRKIKNDKKLDFIEKQLRQQKNGVSHEIEVFSSNNFLDSNKHFIHEILRSTIENIIYLNRSIDGFYNLNFG